MDVQLAAVGVAAPDLRLDAGEIAGAWGAAGGSGPPQGKGGGGRGSVAVCAADEDTLTLAWTAATRALDAAGLAPAAVDGLWWGTTRPPFAEGPNHAYLAASLQLRDDAGGSLAVGSPHAGMEALTAAWDAVAAGSARAALVVASDALVPGLGTSFERRAGAGAVALVLTAETGPATLRSRLTRSRPVLDRYRGDREDATRDLYDGRAVREEVYLPGLAAIVEQLRADGAPDAWSLPDLDGRARKRLGRRVDVDPVDAGAHLGDTGAAAVLLGAAATLGATGTVAAVGAGGGRTTAITIDVEDPVPGAERVAHDLDGGRAASYPEVLRNREQLTPSGEPVPMGVPPGSAMFLRGNTEMLALHGGRCVDCGTISTPPSVHPTCISCGGGKLEAVPLDRRGTIHTFVVNQTMPPPFVAPLPLLVVDLDDGARLMVQGSGDDDVAIGARVALVLRRYAVERGAPVYGYKARVVGDGPGAGDRGEEGHDE